MSEPKYKLGDDGELEEIFDDGDEKPKRKRKPHNRILYIPMSLMLVLITSVILLLLIVYWVTRPSTQPRNNLYTNVYQLPTETPGGYLDQIPPCGILPLTQKPHFVYTIYSGSTSELLRIDVDGTNSCRLTHNNINEDDAGWSPNGERIAFTAYFFAPGYAPEMAIYSMDLKGENVTKLTKDFAYTASPNWSSDGQRILFAGELKGTNNWEIYAMNLDGTNMVNLSNNPHIDSNPSLSPDGQSIVFASDRTFKPEVQGGVSQPNSFEIYTMDASGDNVQQLTSNKLTDLSPKWSPDGQWIVFLHESDAYLMDKNGNHVRRLTHEQYGVRSVFWMPDGNEIGYTNERDAIQFMNIHTGQARSLRIPGQPYSVAPWFPPHSS